MYIRIAKNLDYEDIREIHLLAFPADEREIVSKLAINLLSEVTTPKIISLVAESESIVVGQIAFSPVTFDKDGNLRGYILAPLGVKPEYQGLRIGSRLIENGIQRLSQAGINILFVYGDPKYYSRFGLTVDAAYRYIPPYKLQYPYGWQAIILNEFKAEKVPEKISCVASLCDPELW